MTDAGGRDPRPGRLAHLLPAKVSVSVVFVAGLFVTILDTTIVNVALPTLARDFHVPLSRVDAVVVGFLVSLAVFISVSGWLGDRFGTKRVFLTALVIFTISSALCGLASGLGELTLFRVLQGVGGGMLAPVGMAMLYRTFAPAERVRAARILVVPTAFAPAIGPVLGGLLVTDLSWRWAFYVNVPIGAAAFVFGWLFLSEQRQPAPGRFDVPGFLLAGAGLGTLMWALSEGPSRGWGTPLVDTMAAVGALLLAAFAVAERRTAEPMLDLRLLGDRLFRQSTLVIVASTMAFLGSLYLVALFYQAGFRVSALQSGLSTFPEALGIMAGAQVAGRLYPRFGPRRIIAAGSVGVAATLALVASVPLTASLWWMRVLMLCLGLAQAHVFVPTQAAAFARISPASTGRASTFFNAGRQVGAAVGVAVLSTVFSAVGIGSANRPSAGGFHAGFATAAVLALAAGVLALAIRDEDAAPTMRPRSAPEPVGEPAPVG